MQMVRILTPFVALLLVAPLTTACKAPSASLAGSDQVTTGPMNDKERLQAEQWAQATRGLDFETSDGLVGVEPAFPNDRASADRYLARGDELIAANRVMEALEQYGLSARHDPDLADAYVGIGFVMKHKGRLDDAIVSFRTALDRDAAHLGARYQLAMALWSAAEQEEAIAEMQSILDDDESYAKAHERLAVWHYYVGDDGLAWLHLRRADALGQPVPPQLIALLAGRMPDPGVEKSGR